jgi:hypothetical protein
MQREQQLRVTGRRWRIVPSILGFAFILCLLVLGTTSGTGPRLWLIPATVVVLLVAFSFAKRILPEIATWCEVGITFLLAAIAGSLLIGGAVAAFLWASFDTEYAPVIRKRHSTP